MAWTVEVSATARKALKKLDPPVARRIVRFLRELEALDDPRARGKALTGVLSGLWRYRVGDHRVICDVDDEVLVVHVIEVGHRSSVYDD
ncbi:type II toxin-antitoxin system RelE/ParE family toxin [Kytococcus sedentarius]|uniref:Addiction module toxin, RelE/StbE family n=1 Tax=Kytococcus sedentarius (strain ATCC 14392 / DSM 20547 / JCM 11482 / CCUG 33030 / NBRC 15357 / NCTC 11040 / CCM 314 / 541) TaxID=478801 RepID=C7NFN2_KYTSD|nr:type II toxin-antitoxin system RelE/ParE family toxin [Kytococcus sedentarius]ACV07390.1 addiction module toxin, RelE/StbE family [Kytococcus sedentarius DSM 20547]QQB63346.1 type II toxin-antitoxin system RelE/ParE family toxin [Kytococcus sedentarius]STX13760.1 Toxin RelG [Kytococcus sedentarius]